MVGYGPSLEAVEEILGSYGEVLRQLADMRSRRTRLATVQRRIEDVLGDLDGHITTTQRQLDVVANACYHQLGAYAAQEGTDWRLVLATIARVQSVLEHLPPEDIDAYVANATAILSLAPGEPIICQSLANWHGGHLTVPPRLRWDVAAKCWEVEFTFSGVGVPPQTTRRLLEIVARLPRLIEISDIYVGEQMIRDLAAAMREGHLRSRSEHFVSSLPRLLEEAGCPLEPSVE